MSQFFIVFLIFLTDFSVYAKTKIYVDNIDIYRAFLGSNYKFYLTHNLPSNKSMAYRYNSYSNNYPQTNYYENKVGYNNVSKGYSARNDDNLGEIEYMLQNQRKKFREAKDKYQYDLDNERKMRIQFQNKLIKLKDQYSRKEVALSEIQFKLNNLLHHNQDLSIQNGRLKSELARMEELYGGKIHQLQSQLDMETRNFEETTVQYNGQFDKFKKEGQQYVQQLTFEFQRKIKNLEQKCKNSQYSKREMSLQIKKLNDILVNNKLMFEEEIRDLKNRQRDDDLKKNQSLAKSFQQKIKMIEESKEILARKNKELLRIVQDRDQKIQQLQLQKNDDISKLKQENAEYYQQFNYLNQIVNKLKSEIAQKDSILSRKLNDDSGQSNILRQDLAAKKQEINRLIIQNRDLKGNLKDCESEFDRRRRELVERANIMESQARKYKEEYQRICDVLKSKINDTISNVQDKRR